MTVNSPSRHDPVFVDPTGRRRTALRVTAIVGVCVVGGYLVLVLYALFGGSLPPAARLPLPADLGSGGLPVPTAVNPTTSGITSDAPSTADESVAGSGDPAQPSTTSAATSTSAVPTSTVRKPPKASEPPGQSNRPSNPPGRG
jgi:hypothetical protein